MKFKSSPIRYIILIVCVLIIFAVFIIAMFRLQIVNGDYYKAQSEQKIYSTETIAASRGNIYDRNGEVLVTNRMGYVIKFSKAVMPSDEYNDIILRLIEIMENAGESYYDSLPISKTEPFEFTLEDENAQNKISQLLKDNKLEAEASCSQLLDELYDKYDIDESLDRITARKIVGVRYEMDEAEFSTYTPYIFASDISIDVVTIVKELSADLPGVDIDTQSIRTYTDPTFAPHILGRIGKIYKDEYEELSSKGYGLNDYVGKEGIEKAMESYLRGVDGTRVIERDSSGKVMSVTTLNEPVPGNNVILTIDKELQLTAQQSLERTIKSIAQNGQNKASKEGADADSGAVVVLDVKSGEVLASATYPSYSLENYNANYSALANDSLKPLFNRAFNGTYAPGSTFKMATGIAGLEEGYITPSTLIRDQGVYRKYQGYQPRCWYYSDYGITHGSINVSQALEKSCNYFFYELADQMGIEHLNNYCKKLGLGVKTGLELSEASGILAGPEYRTSINQQWFPGDTLQAAIGQSDNLFTPIQLANYVATIVNGGTRYKTHLVSSVNTSSEGRSVIENNVTVLETLEMKPENFQAIMSGMLAAAKQGTASNLFRNYKVNVGAKTGTASVAQGTANGIFVAFAPYEDPEIAICVVVEHGAHGNYVGQVAKDIMDVYFSQKEIENPVIQDSTLLG